MYRVMVVNSNTDLPAIVREKMSEGDLIPYDGISHNWDDAVRIRENAMEFFPAVVIAVKVKAV